MDWTIIGAWLAAGLTLAMYTFLYGDNPMFKTAEHIYLGVSVGYLIVFSIFQYVWPLLVKPLFYRQQYQLIIPAILALLIVTRLIPPISWLSRISFAAVMGYTAGLAIPTAIRQHIIAQVGDTVQPLVSSGNYTWVNVVNNLIILVGVIAVLVHFFYSVEHKGPIKVTARIGVLFLMFSFGAMFGYTTMGRMSLLFGRTYDLIEFSKPQYGYATPILLVLMIAGLVVWEMRFKPAPEEPGTPGQPGARPDIIEE